MYCIECGHDIGEGQRFCGICGTKVEERDRNYRRSTDAIPNQVRDTFLHATEKVNKLVGEEGTINVNLKDVFSDVFKKHSKEEAEMLFIVGTKTTTPAEENITTTWPKPWLFSRVFLVLAITYALLFVSVDIFQNMNAFPGMIIVGSFVVPFSLLILFWEMNAPRNISIYEVSKMLFVGGAGSLVLTLFLYEFFPVYELTYEGAIIVSFVEELGKLAIIAYFIKKFNSKYILNGLLIGSTIGAGFAAFESAGYAYNLGYMFGETSIIFLRGWMSIGTHIVWSAIVGAALVYVKGNEKLQFEHFKDAKFLKLFLVAVALHAVWDMPLYFLHHFYLLFIMLIVIAWVFIFSLINAGLRQIDRSRNGEL